MKTPIRSLSRGLMLCLLYTGSTLASAESVRSKGMAELQFENEKPSQKQINQANFNAKNNSVERYLSKYRPAAREVLASCPLNEGNIDKIVTNTLSRPPKQKNGVYQIKMRTEIDLERLDSYLQHCGGTTASRIAVILVARQSAGGSSTDTYKAFFGQVDKALANELASKNFTVDSKQDMELFSGGLYREGRLVKQYQQSGQVNWEPAQIAGYLTNIDLMVLGYFDIGKVTTVKLNNLRQVSVSASAEMFDLMDKHVVASTDKIQVKAEAGSDKEVINEAVQLVVEKMGQQLRDKLVSYTMKN